MKKNYTKPYNGECSNPNMGKLFLQKFIMVVCFILSQLIAVSQIHATVGAQSIQAGSKIIDMGVTPQTVANGVKPYESVYQHLKNYIQFINHNLSYLDNKAKLYWEVTDEQNSREYIIESGMDGRSFSAIGSVQVNEGGSGIYHFDDVYVNQLQSENIYYRIRLVEKDGKEKLSKIMLLRMSNATITRPTIKPNPETNFVTVSF